ncbi:hypothetical protein D3C87_109180 [compost metagenome]
MKKTKAKKKSYIKTSNLKEIAEALGIHSPIDQALLEYKADLSVLAVQVIKDSGLSVNQLVERSGVARSKVSAIKNGALANMSSDLFIKVILACGARLQLKLAS